MAVVTVARNLHEIVFIMERPFVSLYMSELFEVHGSMVQWFNGLMV